MTNTIITITVENEEQKNAIIEALDKAEKNGELDFAFGVQVGAEAWKERYEESNHHLDLMVECYGVEALVELVESEDAENRIISRELDKEAEELTDILEDKEGYLNEKENK